MSRDPKTPSSNLETELDGLYASAAAPLSPASSLRIRAFLLRRDSGNLIVYSVPGLAAATQAVDRLGSVERQYLNHWHEAMFASDRLATPLFVHENDRDAAAEQTSVDGTFSSRRTLGNDFELIPTPGHTPGATAFLWDRGEHRFLFTGDTIYLSHGEWVAAVLETSDRSAYIDSLELIRAIDFDVLVPWLATAGEPYYALTDQTDARRRIDGLLDRLRRGETR
jgi:hypothetical protein